MPDEIFGIPCDFVQLPVKRFVLETLAAEPSSPVDGRLFYNSVTKKVEVLRDGAWGVLAANGDSPTFADLTSDRLFLTPGGIIQVGNGSALHFSNGNLDINGTMTANAFVGNGAGLTNLDADALIGYATPVVYASDIPGVNLNATADANGCYGRDNSAEIQAVHDDHGGFVDIVIDGPCLIDKLRLSSEATLRGLTMSPSCGLYKKGRPNSGESMIVNANPRAWPLTPVDRNITIKNLYIDGNRRGYGSGNTETVPAFSSGYFPFIMNNSGYGQVGIGMYGVANLRISNVYVFNPTAYGLNLGNVRTARIIDFSKWRKTGDANPTDAVIQLQGGCDDIVMVRPAGTCVDDAIGCNANDGQDIPRDPYIGPPPGYVAPGPITRVRINDFYFPTCYQVLRLLSAHQDNYIRNVRVHGGRATIGSVENSGFAGFMVDDFGITGPLADGTHGLVDDVVIDGDVFIDGNQTGGYGVVHFGACRVGRFEVHGLRARTNSANPVGSVVYGGADATVDTFKGSNIVNEALVAGKPAVKFLKVPRSLELDGLEFDMAVAGANLPFAWTGSAAQAFYPTALVDLSGSGCEHLAVRGSKTAGIANVVRLRAGCVPKTMIVGGLSHSAAKGGAVVQADTAQTDLTFYGIVADQAFEGPGGSNITYPGRDFIPTETVKLRADFFESDAGVQYAAGTLLQSTVSENGVGWNLPVAGTGNIRISGTGTVFGDGPCIQPVDFPGRPTGDDFKVEFDIVRKSNVTAGEWAYLQFFADGGYVSDFLGFVLDSTSLSIRHNNADVLATSPDVPAVGVVWRIRCRFTRTAGSNDWLCATDYSTDAGRTWAFLFELTVTIAQTSTLALYTLGAASATTGNHIGGIVVSSYAYDPDPVRHRLGLGIADTPRFTGVIADGVRGQPGNPLLIAGGTGSVLYLDENANSSVDGSGNASFVTMNINGDGSFGGNLSVSGNLFVSGTESTYVGRSLVGLDPPTDDTAATNKSYVDLAINAAVEGLDWKNSVRYASGQNNDVSAMGGQVGDDPLSEGDRVLLVGQDDPAENGIYVYDESNDILIRAPDANSDAEVTSGMTVMVTEGTNGGTGWRLTTHDTIELGTTALTFTQIPVGAMYAPGFGIGITGNVISLSQAIAPTWINQHIFKSSLPTVFRQSGGAAGVDELQVGYSGTGALIESKGTTSGQMMTFKVPDSKNFEFVGGGNGTKVIFKTDGATKVRVQKGNISLGSDGTIAFTATAGNGDLTADTALVRSSAGTVRVTDGSTGTGSLIANAVKAVAGAGAFTVGTATAAGGGQLIINSNGSVELYTANAAGDFSAKNLGPFVAQYHLAFSNDCHNTNGDVGLNRTAAGILRVTNATTGGGTLEFKEQTAPAAGAADTARLFSQDNGSGKTQLCVRFPTGAVQVLSTEP